MHVAGSNNIASLYVRLNLYARTVGFMVALTFTLSATTQISADAFFQKFVSLPITEQMHIEKESPLTTS